jgi:nucleotide-binding universal stress UspA family protein
MGAAFRNVLVATDGSPLADRAIELGLRLADGSRLTALTVVHDYGLPQYLRAAARGRPDAQQLREALVADGRRLLGEAIARVCSGDAAVEQQVVLSDRAPCHEIVSVAQRQGCDVIVMSSHGLGGRMAGLLGSQTQAVLSLAKVPVLVTR